ncbi:FUSC family protein [Legionella spiritensis]|uniref:p-hydroxybenzoic acid efflux subunit AaeB n=1 Tax=Legionella spiritensis TaxID=452 RepID=A0A0W0ZAB8_LEGSP|nr:FUSC family protein [Legionella spiritensis]KTD65718.1 p-hydroxybenzoic acid efflux subunit AaeB [Legionella spiritensis]SNV43303.1 p-hydroxybenzoic acid efflux pump subunit AaeB [Legionella spiritensis]
MQQLLRIANEWTVIFKPFIPQSKENRAALRTAIAALVAVFIAFLLHFDKPYWSGMTVVILANIYTGNIIDKALMRIVGTVIGASLGYFLAGFIVNSFFLYFLACFVIVAAAVYYYNFSSYAYAYLLTALSAFLVISELALNPEDAFYVAIWRSVEIGLGVLVSAAAAFCLFPNNIHEIFLQEADELFDGFNELLTQLRDDLLNDNTSLDVMALSRRKLRKKVKKTTEMIGFMRREIGFSRRKIDAFRLLVDSFFSLVRVMTYFTTARHYKAVKKNLRHTAFPVAAMFTAAQLDLMRLKAAFLQGRRVVPVERIGALDGLLLNLASESGDHQDVDLEMAYLFRKINHIFMSLHNVLQGSRPETPGKRFISTKQRLHNDPDVIKHGIKAGLSVILALGFWLVSNWPGGLNGIISSLVISIRKHLYEMQNISIYRLLGCLCGGGLALFSLTYFKLNLYDFTMVMFFGIWGFSYFSFKFTSHAYIGLQANIALIIAMAQEGGPPSVLAPPLERLGGILIGIVASFIVANTIWRVDLVAVFVRRVNKLSRYLMTGLRNLLAEQERGRQLYDLTSLFWASREAMETLDNERLKPQKQVLVDRTKQQFHELILLQATLRHIFENIDQQQACHILVKAGYEPNTLHAAVLGCYEPVIRGDVDRVIKQLEEAVTVISGNTDIGRDDRENSVSYLNSLIQLVHLAREISCLE